MDAKLICGDEKDFLVNNLLIAGTCIAKYLSLLLGTTLKATLDSAT